MASYLLQEDGSSKIILEDGSGFLLLEDSATSADVRQILLGQACM